MSSPSTRPTLNGSYVPGASAWARIHSRFSPMSPGAAAPLRRLDDPPPHLRPRTALLLRHRSRADQDLDRTAALERPPRGQALAGGDRLERVGAAGTGTTASGRQRPVTRTTPGPARKARQGTCPAHASDTSGSLRAGAPSTAWSAAPQLLVGDRPVKPRLVHGRAAVPAEQALDRVRTPLCSSSSNPPRPHVRRRATAAARSTRAHGRFNRLLLRSRFDSTAATRTMRPHAVGPGPAQGGVSWPASRRSAARLLQVGVDEGPRPPPHGAPWFISQP